MSACMFDPNQKGHWASKARNTAGLLSAIAASRPVGAALHCVQTYQLSAGHGHLNVHVSWSEGLRVSKQQGRAVYDPGNAVQKKWQHGDRLSTISIPADE